MGKKRDVPTEGPMTDERAMAPPSQGEPRMDHQQTSEVHKGPEEFDHRTPGNVHEDALETRTLSAAGMDGPPSSSPTIDQHSVPRRHPVTLQESRDAGGSMPRMGEDVAANHLVNATRNPKHIDNRKELLTTMRQFFKDNDNRVEDHVLHQKLDEAHILYLTSTRHIDMSNVVKKEWSWVGPADEVLVTGKNLGVDAPDTQRVKTEPGTYSVTPGDAPLAGDGKAGEVTKLDAGDAPGERAPLGGAQMGDADGHARPVEPHVMGNSNANVSPEEGINAPLAGDGKAGEVTKTEGAEGASVSTDSPPAHPGQ